MKYQMLRRSFFCLLIVFCYLSLVGCASMMPKVPMAPLEKDSEMKTFPQPDEGMAGLYIYRDSMFGGVILDPISLDDTYIGKLAINTYLYREIAPGSHTLSIPTEFAHYSLDLDADSGKNYFVHYYMRMGVFRGSGALEIAEPDVAKKGISNCNLIE